MIRSSFITSILAFFVLTGPVRGEEVFNIPFGASEEQSRQASASLLDGVEQVFRGLAQIERKLYSASTDTFSGAAATLEKAADQLDELASSLGDEGLRQVTARVEAFEERTIIEFLSWYNLWNLSGDKLEVESLISSGITVSQILETAAHDARNLAGMIREGYAVVSQGNPALSEKVLDRLYQLSISGTVATRLMDTRS